MTTITNESSLFSFQNPAFKIEQMFPKEREIIDPKTNEKKIFKKIENSKHQLEHYVYTDPEMDDENYTTEEEEEVEEKILHQSLDKKVEEKEGKKEKDENEMLETKNIPEKRQSLSRVFTKKKLNIQPISEKISNFALPTKSNENFDFPGKEIINESNTSFDRMFGSRNKNPIPAESKSDERFEFIEPKDDQKEMNFLKQIENNNHQQNLLDIKNWLTNEKNEKNEKSEKNEKEEIQIDKNDLNILQILKTIKDIKKKFSLLENQIKELF